MKTILLLVFIPGFLGHSFSQTKTIIPFSLTYQNDSILKNYVIPSLNAYLDQAEADNDKNQFISPKNKVCNFILTDELRGLQKSGRFKREFFYKPTLVEAIPQKNSGYFLQLAYMGTADSTSILVGCFDLIAEKSTDSKYVFSSPIITNSGLWKSKKVGIIEFHYKNNLNEEKAIQFNKYVERFDKKLNNVKQSIHYYACSDATEVFRLLGIGYLSRYNGQSTFSLGSSDAQEAVFVSSAGGEAFDSFDPHDLWHDRLSQHIPRDKVNKSIDEACAYLYGGSWGMTWKEIFNAFKEKVSSDKQKDWLTNYGKYENFAGSQELHLYPEYVINALLVQKIEREKGFQAVLEFLRSGKNDPEDKSNTNYFAALYKLTGISKDNYNTSVWALIENESK
ncbi:MAG: hypothetical protein IPP42_18515 [Saprospiraceae bacterium]|nr:hypothetical protein [Saprospiraceae bacterium]